MQTPQLSNSRTFSSLQKKPRAHWRSVPTLPPPGPAPTTLPLSLWTYLLWTFHTSESAFLHSAESFLRLSSSPGFVAEKYAIAWTCPVLSAHPSGPPCMDATDAFSFPRVPSHFRFPRRLAASEREGLAGCSSLRPRAPHTGCPASRGVAGRSQRLPLASDGSIARSRIPVRLIGQGQARTASQAGGTVPG